MACSAPIRPGRNRERSVQGVAKRVGDWRLEIGRLGDSGAEVGGGVVVGGEELGDSGVEVGEGVGDWRLGALSGEVGEGRLGDMEIGDWIVADGVWAMGAAGVLGADWG
jgi:hypothetical protein